MDKTTILKWATALGLALACNGVESSQVQQLLKMATNDDKPFDTLQLFARYQAARKTWSYDAARLFVEAIQWLKNKNANEDDLRSALGYVKWVHRTIVNLGEKGVCHKDWHISFDQLVSQTDPDNVFRSIAEKPG